MQPKDVYTGRIGFRDKKRGLRSLRFKTCQGQEKNLCLSLCLTPPHIQGNESPSAPYH